MDMELVFSMEELLGPFWDLPPLPPLPEEPLVTGITGVIDDGVATHGGGDGEGGDMLDQNNMEEWTFERLLEEELLTNTMPVANSSFSTPNVDPLTNTMPVANSSFSTLNVNPVVAVDHGTMAPAAVSAVGGDPMEYNAILKRKLEEDLVAFRMWRASSSAVNSEGSNNHNEGTKNPVQNKLNNGEGPSNNHAQNADLRVRLGTSSSSMDPSPSDEEVEGEVEILGFKMPTEERVRKRKESNRESARRSRYRKAAHLKELEDQVEQLKAENSSLLRRLAALNQKYNDANVDNRVLKADMETLRAKVQMGEDSLKRAIEMNALNSIPIPTLPNSDAEMNSLNSIPIPTLPNSDASVIIPDDIINYLTTTPTDDALVDNSFMPMPNPLQLQLQAEEPSTSGTLNTTTEINQIATLQESELLRPDETINMDMF